MLISELVVRSEEPVMVAPTKPMTFPWEVLYLSNLDDQLFLRFTIKYIFAYPNYTASPFSAPSILKHSLSQVLDHYYPLAGRLRQTKQSHDKLEVVCNGEGAVFVEAQGDFTVEELLQGPKPCKSWKKLFYRYDSNNFIDIPPLVIQVTETKCGGFVMCVGFSHCLCDGIGSSQFLQAWAQIARGESKLSTTPTWDRQLLSPRNPARVDHVHREFTSIEDTSNWKEVLRQDAVVKSGACFDTEDLGKLKETVAKWGLSCTSFEALAAHVWRSWTKSLDLPWNQQIRLLFSCNVREKMVPELPPGFYGNGFVLACAETTVEELLQSPLAFGVKLVQNAKNFVSDGYVRSLIDNMEEHKTLKPDLVATLVISQWSRLGLHLVDFGLGKPAHMGPITSDIYCIFSPCDCHSDSEIVTSNVKVLLSVPLDAKEVFESSLHNLNDFKEFKEINSPLPIRSSNGDEYVHHHLLHHPQQV